MSIYLIGAKAGVLSANQKDFVETLSADGRINQELINRMTYLIQPSSNYVIQFVKKNEFQSRVDAAIKDYSLLTGVTMFQGDSKDFAYIDNFERRDEMREFQENVNFDFTMVLLTKHHGATDTHMFIYLPEIIN